MQKIRGSVSAALVLTLLAACSPPQASPDASTAAVAVPAVHVVERAAVPAPVVCNACGVVRSITAVSHEGQATGAGAVIGGIVGGVAGNQVGGGSGRKSYAAFLSAASTEYTSKTHIVAGQGPNGEGKIEYINLYHPYAAAAAAAQPFYGTTPCAALNGNYDMVTNGNCHYTSERPQTAKIYINDRIVDDRYNPGNASDIYWDYGDIIIRHELGHVLGLAHNDTNPTGGTFMETYPDASTPMVLNALEIIWINNHY